MALPASIAVGDKFTNRHGTEAIVIEYVSSTNITIQLLGPFKHVMRSRGDSLHKGSFKTPFCPSVYGIGYLGVGNHPMFKDAAKAKPTAAYGCWRSILLRAAQGVDKNWEHYRDCTVCEEWLCFQTFAEWYNSFEVYDFVAHIDKDILSPGNRHYAPEFCTLVPRLINNAFTVKTKYRDNGLPTGVERSGKRFSVSLRKRSVAVGLGTFDTMEEAGEVYVKGKEEYVQSLAVEYQAVIEPRTYDAIMRWSAVGH